MCVGKKTLKKISYNEMGLKRLKMKKLEDEMFVSAPLFIRSETVCITTKLFHFLSLLIWCYPSVFKFLFFLFGREILIKFFKN